MDPPINYQPYASPSASESKPDLEPYQKYPAVSAYSTSASSTPIGYEKDPNPKTPGTPNSAATSYEMFTPSENEKGPKLEPSNSNSDPYFSTPNPNSYSSDSLKASSDSLKGSSDSTVSIPTSAPTEGSSADKSPKTVSSSTPAYASAPHSTSVLLISRNANPNSVRP
jgi:hypothetical protein